MGESIAEVAAIAAKLTKAQRARLFGLAKLYETGLSWASRYGSRRINAARASTSSLLTLGLIENDHGDAILTADGKAVLHLISQGADHDRRDGH